MRKDDRERPSVSFVVPCYNYGRFLGDCLKSIFAQTARVEFEVIVLDDASTDNTREVIASFRDRRLVPILHERNQGHIITINKGLYLARGRFVARIDADDRYRPEFLERTLAVFERHPEVGMVYGRAALMDAEGKLTGELPAAWADRKANIFVELLERNFVTAPTVIARKEAWERALPIPDGVSYSDWYLNLNIARRFPCYYVDGILADYRVHGTSLHHQIGVDGSQERTTFRILKQIFSEKEADPALEKQKRRRRHRIYGATYLEMARKYFGAGRYDQARRCYLSALFHRQPALFRVSDWRCLLACLTSPRLYASAKRLLLPRKETQSPSDRDRRAA